MSAFIVSRTHIDALVTAAQSRAIGCADASPFRYWFNGESRSVQMYDQAAADDLGRTLWLENLRSVAARYPNDASGDRPGPCDLRDEEIEGYTFSPVPGTPDAVTTLTLIRCLEYQSCETDDWQQTEAYAILQALTQDCIRKIPGSKINWAATDRYTFAPEMRPKLAAKAV
jgi:hypothetical protein